MPTFGFLDFSPRLRGQTISTSTAQIVFAHRAVRGTKQALARAGAVDMKVKKKSLGDKGVALDAT